MEISKNFLTGSIVAVGSLANLAVLSRERQSNEKFITLIAFNALAGVAIARLREVEWAKTTKRALIGAAVVISALALAILFPSVRNSQALAKVNILITNICRSALFGLNIMKPSVSQNERLRSVLNEGIKKASKAEETIDALNPGKKLQLARSVLNYHDGGSISGSFSDKIIAKMAYIFVKLSVVVPATSTSLRK